MPNFIRTKDDEARWSKAKNAATKSKNKGEESFSDQDWALVNHIYHQMGKAEELGKAIKEMISSGANILEIERLQRILKKARDRFDDDEGEESDDLNPHDPHGAAYDEALEDQGFREFDPDKEGQDDADKWLMENDQERKNDEDDDEDSEYDEYAPEEDEEAHQRVPSEVEEEAETSEEEPEAEPAAPEEEMEAPAETEPAETPQETQEVKESRFGQPTKEEIAELRQYTRPWEHRARDRSRLEAEPTKNPILHHEGRIVEARNLGHKDFQAAHAALHASPEFQAANRITKMKMETNFKKDWYAKNPDYVHNTEKLHQQAHLHGLKGHSAHAAEKEEAIRHVVGGGAQPENAMSVEEGMQHAGATRGEEGTEGTVIQDPATKFAAANKEVLATEGPKHQQRTAARRGSYDKLAGQYASKVHDMPEYDRKKVHEILGEHPALKDPKNKAKIDAFFEKYHPLIGMNAKRVMSKLGLDPSKGGIDTSSLNEAGMHGLFQAINDYDHDHPSKASFATHASNKIRGLMHTALKGQQQSMGGLENVVKQPSKPQGVSKVADIIKRHHPDIQDRHNRINTSRQVHILRKPKPSGEGQQ